MLQPALPVKIGLTVDKPVSVPSNERYLELHSPVSHECEQDYKEHCGEAYEIGQHPAYIWYPCYEEYQQGQRQEHQDRLHGMEPDEPVLLFDEQENYTRHPQPCIAQCCNLILFNTQFCIVCHDITSPQWYSADISPHIFHKLYTYPDLSQQGNQLQ